MGINNQNNLKNNQSDENGPVQTKQHLEVIILKLGILLVILIIPVAFMLFDAAKPLLVKKQTPDSSAEESKVNRITADQNNYNFEVDLPSGGADIADVSDEKINTLFNNLKE